MNAIDTITRDNLDSGIARLNLKLTINALTGALVSEAMSYIARTNQGENLPKDEPVTIDSFEADADRNDQFEDEMREEQGFSVNNPYKNMCLLNGLRVRLYNELHAFTDIPVAARALYKEFGTPPGTAINYDQPMSAQKFIEYRVSRAGDVDERALKRALQAEPDADAQRLRGVFAERAKQDKARLEGMAAAVLTEINGLPETTYDTSGFDALPVRLQVSIVEKIIAKLKARNEQLLVSWARSGKETIAAERKLVKAEIDTAQAALDELVRKQRHAANV